MGQSPSCGLHVMLQRIVDAQVCAEALVRDKVVKVVLVSPRRVLFGDERDEVVNLMTFPHQ